MIKHIVLWKLKDKAQGSSKQMNSLIAKEKLESLNGKIPGLIKLEVGIDFSDTDNSADLVLYSEFESKESLHQYQNHPEHKKVMPFMLAIRDERRVIDYEI